jgi:hypothetical protein
VVVDGAVGHLFLTIGRSLLGGCGATVDFNTQVSLLPASARLPDNGGNVLIVDDRRIAPSVARLTNSEAVCSRLIRGVGLGSKTDDERLLL